LKDENFWRVFKNTVLFNLYYLIWGFPAPIILALLLNEVTGKWFKKTVQTISYLPYFISWVVVSSIVVSVLSPTSGIVNMLLTNVFGMDPIYFLSKPEYFRTIVIVTWIWKDVGYYSVYYLAALTSIDPQLYEASRIDGASRWQQTLHITLPGIKPIAMVLFMLTIGNLATVGIDQVFNLYNPLVYNVGDVISTYTYRLGLEKMQYSLTTAIGVTQSAINFILIFSANKIVKKINGWAMW
jgi:putative aldouronate transport system permease protein